MQNLSVAVIGCHFIVDHIIQCFLVYRFYIFIPGMHSTHSTQQHNHYHKQPVFQSEGLHQQSKIQSWHVT